MAKKKYVKPIMVSEEFVSEHYIAACEVIVGTIFDGTLECGKHVRIQISSTSTGEGSYQGNPIVNGTPTSSFETIFIDKNNKGYGYAGSINDGAHNYQTYNGEYLPQGYAGDVTEPLKQCDHVFTSPVQHHHFRTLTITNKNNS